MYVCVAVSGNVCQLSKELYMCTGKRSWRGGVGEQRREGKREGREGEKEKGRMRRDRELKRSTTHLISLCISVDRNHCHSTVSYSPHYSHCSDQEDPYLHCYHQGV